MYDPVFIVSPKEDPKVTEARSFKALLIALLCYAVGLTYMICLYLWVDRNNVIPRQWIEVIEQTCPVYKKSSIFHHASLVHTGYFAALPLYYLWNWMKHRSWARNGRPKSEEQKASSWFAIGFKVIALLLCDHLICEVVPVWIYGTKNIEPFPDLAKRTLLMVSITWLAGPFNDWLKSKGF